MEVEKDYKVIFKKIYFKSINFIEISVVVFLRQKKFE